MTYLINMKNIIIIILTGLFIFYFFSYVGLQAKFKKSTELNNKVINSLQIAADALDECVPALNHYRGVKTQ